MNALQEIRDKEEIPTKLELAILYYDNLQEYDEAGIGDAEAAASELAALRKELEEAKALIEMMLNNLQGIRKMTDMRPGEHWDALPKHVYDAIHNKRP